MTASTEARRKSAELAQRFSGWTIWATAQGSPAATRSGRQRPPEPYDGTWAQTLIADDWDKLETELAAQAKYDAERLSNPATYGLPYQTDDTLRVLLTMTLDQHEVESLKCQPEQRDRYEGTGL